MQSVKDMEIGAMFWAGRDPLVTLRELKNVGIRCGQLGIPGGMTLDGAALSAWKTALEIEQFALVTVFAAFNGENYADIPTVQRTVGFVPPATRVEREKRTLEVSDFAAALGAPAIALHVGAIPDSPGDPTYTAVRDMVRRIAGHAAAHSQVFALETGQEAARMLRSFILDAACPNVRINFDPANMIMYGSGDPIEALDYLGEWVVSVHCKDGDWPPADQPAALGSERPLGQGSVGVPRLIEKLRAIGCRAPLCIEREIEDREQWLSDIRAAVSLLEKARVQATAS